MITWAAVQAMPAQRMIDTVLVAATRNVMIAGPAARPPGPLVTRDGRGTRPAGHRFGRISPMIGRDPADR